MVLVACFAFIENYNDRGGRGRGQATERVRMDERPFTGADETGLDHAGVGMGWEKEGEQGARKKNQEKREKKEAGVFRVMTGAVNIMLSARCLTL